MRHARASRDRARWRENAALAGGAGGHRADSGGGRPIGSDGMVTDRMGPAQGRFPASSSASVTAPAQTVEGGLQAISVVGRIGSLTDSLVLHIHNFVELSFT